MSNPFISLKTQHSSFQYTIPIILGTSSSLCFACSIITAVGAYLAFVYGIGTVAIALLTTASGAFAIFSFLLCTLAIIFAYHKTNKNIFKPEQPTDNVIENQDTKTDDKNENPPTEIKIEIPPITEQSSLSKKKCNTLLLRQEIKNYLYGNVEFSKIQSLVNDGEASIQGGVDGTLLHWLFKQPRWNDRHHQLYHFLIECGKKENCLNAQDKDGNFLLNYAINKDQASALISNGFSLKVQNGLEETPLMNFMKLKTHPEIINFLIRPLRKL